MIPLIGYDASYQRQAFKSQIDPDGLPRMALESSIKQAARIVHSKSEGRWLVTIKAGFVPFDMDEPVELMVIVPAGTDQYDQYLAAVKEFEDCITGYPFMDPMDSSLRTLEEDWPSCSDCSERAEWLCRTQTGVTTFFCAQHATKSPHFDEPGFGWFQYEAADTLT